VANQSTRGAHCRGPLDIGIALRTIATVATRRAER